MILKPDKRRALNIVFRITEQEERRRQAKTLDVECEAREHWNGGINCGQCDYMTGGLGGIKELSSACRADPARGFVSAIDSCRLFKRKED